MTFLNRIYLRGTLVRQLLTLIGVAIISLPGPALGQVYRVEDDQGQVIYTDSPGENTAAQRIELPPINTQPGLTAPDKTGPAGETTGAAPVVDQIYTTAYILQPENDSTVPPGQLDVVVQVALEPTLQPGHLLQLYFDGQAYGEPVAGTAFSINELMRGSHSIHAKIIGPDGEVLVTTDPVVIFVHRASAGG